MGFYINSVDNFIAPAVGKDKYLIERANALVLDEAPRVWIDQLVCVVHNGAFDAALYVHNQAELDVVLDPRDTRRKTWLLVPNAKELSGYVG